MTSVVFQSRTSCKVTFIADIIALPWYDLRSHKCSGLQRKKNDCGWFHIHQTLQVCAAFLKMLVFKVHFVAEEWQLKNTIQAPYNALYQLAFFVSHFNVLWSLIVLIYHSMVHRSHVELPAIKDWQTKPHFSQSELKASQPQAHKSVCNGGTLVVKSRQWCLTCVTLWYAIKTQGFCVGLQVSEALKNRP